MENLKPQFVPGQAMGPSLTTSLAMEDKIAHLQISQENDQLKGQVRPFQTLKFFIIRHLLIRTVILFQIRELNERIEILRVKRMQDKDKMKEFEKIRLQLEQLIEFKSKVMESQVMIFFLEEKFFHTSSTYDFINTWPGFSTGEFAKRITESTARSSRCPRCQRAISGRNG